MGHKELGMTEQLTQQFMTMMFSLVLPVAEISVGALKALGRLGDLA